MGMHGQGQTVAREKKAGPISCSARSDALSSLKVIVRLTMAAKGKGSVLGELPPASNNLC